MTGDIATQIGVGGIFVLLVLQQLKPYLLNGRNGKNGKHPKLGYVREEHCFGDGDKKLLRDLHRWHAPDQETGRFKWYDHNDEVISSLDVLGEKISRQTDAINSLVHHLKRSHGQGDT